MIITSLLDTDFYKFSMMNIVLHKFPAAMVEYEFKCRTPNINLVQHIDEIQEEINGTSSTSGQSNNSRINYYFLPILLVLCIFYFLTYTLSNKKKIKIIQHRRIWNVILLITFLISGIFGIILAILISYGIRLTFYSDLLFWHVEMGIAMAIISIFHIAWHWKYFKRIVKRKS